MAFQTKYRATIKHRNGTSYNYDIQEDGFSGSIKTFEMDAPIYETGGGEITEPVSDTQINIPIRNAPVSIAKEALLSTEGDLKVKVTDTSDGGTYFEGFVLPDQSNVVKGHPNLIGQIAASDLALLDGLYFTSDSTKTGDTYSGRYSLTDVFAIILSKLGYDADLFINYDWVFDTTYDADQITPDVLGIPLDVYRDDAIDPREFNPLRCLEVIKELLAANGLNLRWGPGGFYVTQVEQLTNGSIDYNRYSITGGLDIFNFRGELISAAGAAFVESVTITDTTFDDEDVTRSYPQTSAVPSTETVSTTYDFEYIRREGNDDTFDPNPNFEFWTRQQGLTSYELLAPFANVIGREFFDNPQEPEYLVFVAPFAGSVYPDRVLKQDLGFVAGNQNLNFRLEINYRFETPDGKRTQLARRPPVPVEFRVGDWVYTGPPRYNQVRFDTDEPLEFLRVDGSADFYYDGQFVDEIVETAKDVVIPLSRAPEDHFDGIGYGTTSGSDVIMFIEGTKIQTDLATLTLKRPLRYGDTEIIADVERRDSPNDELWKARVPPISDTAIRPALAKNDTLYHGWMVHEDNMNATANINPYFRLAEVQEKQEVILPVPLATPDGTEIRGTVEKYIRQIDDTLFPAEEDGDSKTRVIYDRLAVIPVGGFGENKTSITTTALDTTGSNRGNVTIPAHRVGTGPASVIRNALIDLNTDALALDFGRTSSDEGLTLDEVNVFSWLQLLARTSELETNVEYRSIEGVDFFPNQRIISGSDLLWALEQQFNPVLGRVQGSYVFMEATPLTAEFNSEGENSDSGSSSGGGGGTFIGSGSRRGNVVNTSFSNTIAITTAELASGQEVTSIPVEALDEEVVISDQNVFIVNVFSGKAIPVTLVGDQQSGATSLTVQAFVPDETIGAESRICITGQSLQSLVTQTDKAFRVTVRSDRFASLTSAVGASTATTQLDVDYCQTILKSGDKIYLDDGTNTEAFTVDTDASGNQITVNKGDDTIPVESNTASNSFAVDTAVAFDTTGQMASQFEINPGLIQFNSELIDIQGAFQFNKFIRSNNFNGVINDSGNITDPGTTGIAITAAGDAVFTNATIRDSLISGAIFAGDQELENLTVTGNLNADDITLTNQEFSTARQVNGTLMYDASTGLAVNYNQVGTPDGYSGYSTLLDSVNTTTGKNIELTGGRVADARPDLSLATHLDLNGTVFIGDAGNFNDDWPLSIRTSDAEGSAYGPTSVAYLQQLCHKNASGDGYSLNIGYSELNGEKGFVLKADTDATADDAALILGNSASRPQITIDGDGDVQIAPDSALDLFETVQFNNTFQTPGAVAGFTGSGTQLQQGEAWFDDLNVRGTLLAFEFEARKITASRGPLSISPGGGKIESIEFIGGGIYRATFAENPGIAAGDLLLVQEIDATNTSLNTLRAFFRATGADTANKTADIDFIGGDGFSLSDLNGADIVVIGSNTDPDRRSLLYLDPYVPAFDVLTGIQTRNDWNTRSPVIRLGELDGYSLQDGTQLSGMGLYAQNNLYADNAYLRGEIVAETGEIAVWDINATTISNQNNVFLGEQLEDDDAPNTALFGNYSGDPTWKLRGPDTNGNQNYVFGIGTSSTTVPYFEIANDGNKVMRVTASGAAFGNVTVNGQITVEETLLMDTGSEIRNSDFSYVVDDAGMRFDLGFSDADGFSEEGSSLYWENFLSPLSTDPKDNATLWIGTRFDPFNGFNTGRMAAAENLQFEAANTFVFGPENPFTSQIQNIQINTLPTSEPVQANTLWNDNGTVKISS